MKTQHVGTISGRELLKHSSIGHQEHRSGCGAHKDAKRDKKTRRNEDKRACQDN